jgi:hypothetical protein
LVTKITFISIIFSHNKKTFFVFENKRLKSFCCPTRSRSRRNRLAIGNTEHVAAATLALTLAGLNKIHTPSVLTRKREIKAELRTGLKF